MNARHLIESLSNDEIDAEIAEHQSDLVKALAIETNPARVKLLKAGHGRFEGTCGHVVMTRRCPTKSHGGVSITVKVDHPCRRCRS